MYCQNIKLRHEATRYTIDEIIIRPNPIMIYFCNSSLPPPAVSFNYKNPYATCNPLQIDILLFKAHYMLVSQLQQLHVGFPIR